MARRGQLSRMHQVSTDGTNWVRASEYAELFVGVPIKLVAPEPAAPDQQPAGEAPIPLSDDQVVVAQPAASQAVVPAAAPQSWYYHSRGSQYGPVDDSVLRQMLVIGQLDGNTLVWAEGMAQWTVASQVPGLAPAPAMNRPARLAGQHAAEPGEDMGGLCKAAMASRPWALFLAIVALVLAALSLLSGFFMLVHGATSGNPFSVAMGLFVIISGAVNGAGGILLASYATRLSSLTYSPSATVLESAMERLKSFWMFVSIVLIVHLAFLGFFLIWALAVGVSLPHYM